MIDLNCRLSDMKILSDFVGARVVFTKNEHLKGDWFTCGESGIVLVIATLRASHTVTMLCWQACFKIKLKTKSRFGMPGMSSKFQIRW